MLLEIREMTVHYGKAMALEKVCMKVEESEVVAIVGSNGAGKSTILKAISGLLAVTEGSIIFDGEKINGLEPFQIVKRGIIQVPEGRRLFPYLSVITNLSLGASLRKDKKNIKKDLEKVFSLFPVLKDRYYQKAHTLSGGEQQMLAIARGLMAKPRLLLLDEPTLGLAPLVIRELIDVIKEVNRGGVTVLLAEQNIPFALRVAKRCYVLQLGKVVFEDYVERMKDNEAIKKAYLGL